MKAHILSTHGSCDGIRYGDMRFDSVRGPGFFRRRYYYDRLNGTVQLWIVNGTAYAGTPEPDDTPSRLSAALDVLRGRP